MSANDELRIPRRVLEHLILLARPDVVVDDWVAQAMKILRDPGQPSELEEIARELLPSILVRNQYWLFHEAVTSAFEGADMFIQERDCRRSAR